MCTFRLKKNKKVAVIFECLLNDSESYKPFSSIISMIGSSEGSIGYKYNTFFPRSIKKNTCIKIFKRDSRDYTTLILLVLKNSETIYSKYFSIDPVPSLT